MAHRCIYCGSEMASEAAWTDHRTACLLDPLCVLPDAIVLRWLATRTNDERLRFITELRKMMCMDCGKADPGCQC